MIYRIQLTVGITTIAAIVRAVIGYPDLTFVTRHRALVLPNSLSPLSGCCYIVWRGLNRFLLGRRWVIEILNNNFHVCVTIMESMSTQNKGIL